MAPNHDDSLPIYIYTIGYGARRLDMFVELLANYCIEFLLDVRSRPYSKFRPEFSREPLERVLKDARIHYVFMGDALGGQPQDAAYYTPDGKVDYQKYQNSASFLEGIDRLTEASKQLRRIALMCSEAKPEKCHRSKLIGNALARKRLSILHIDENGDIKTQEAVMATLTGRIHDADTVQATLFPEMSLQLLASRKRYKDISGCEE